MADINLDPSLLEDYALESGATLHRANGEVFNAAGRTGVYRLPKRAEATPAPAPAEDQSAKLANVLAEMVAKMQAPAAPVINAAPAQVVIQPTAKVSWRFEFERNSDNTIKAIIAKPI